jgi:hypothetical protein
MVGHLGVLARSEPAKFLGGDERFASVNMLPLESRPQSDQPFPDVSVCRIMYSSKELRYRHT